MREIERERRCEKRAYNVNILKNDYLLYLFVYAYDVANDHVKIKVYLKKPGIRVSVYGEYLLI